MNLAGKIIVGIDALKVVQSQDVTLSEKSAPMEILIKLDSVYLEELLVICLM